MKKLILACCLGAAVVTAYAQPQEKHGPDANQRLTFMQKSLQLSNEQTQKVKPILEQSDQQRKALRDKYDEQFKAFHADMKNLDDQTHSQLAGVLTPSQLQALDTQRGARKHFRHGPGPRFGGPHGEARQAPPAP